MWAVNTYRDFRAAMPTNDRSRWIGWSLLTFLTFLAASASAQPLVDATPMRLSYASPLSGYRAWDDQQVRSWRDANDRVGRIGGWRAYSREAQTVNTPVQLPGVKPTLPDGGHNGPHNSQHNSHQMGGRP